MVADGRLCAAVVAYTHADWAAPLRPVGSCEMCEAAPPPGLLFALTLLPPYPAGSLRRRPPAHCMVADGRLCAAVVAYTHADWAAPLHSVWRRSMLSRLKDQPSRGGRGGAPQHNRDK